MGQLHGQEVAQLVGRVDDIVGRHGQLLGRRGAVDLEYGCFLVLILAHQIQPLRVTVGLRLKAYRSRLVH
jgi:hypothetical protein